MADDYQFPPDDPEALSRSLREARPRWATDGHGVRGPQSERSPQQPMAAAPAGSVVREAKQPAFPDLAEDQPTPAEAAAAETNEYSFKLKLSEIDKDAYTVEIHVGYGEINDTPPDGMTGADDYTLTIPGAADGTEIYAIGTYDTDTLEITSRSLAFGDSVPDSTLGTLYIPIGFVDITYDESGGIKEVNPHNRQCGDIVIAFLYGSLNGAPALFPIRTYGEPQALP